MFDSGGHWVPRKEEQEVEVADIDCRQLPELKRRTIWGMPTSEWSSEVTGRCKNKTLSCEKPWQPVHSMRSTRSCVPGDRDQVSYKVRSKILLWTIVMLKLNKMIHTNEMLFHLCGRGRKGMTRDLPGINWASRFTPPCQFMGPKVIPNNTRNFSQDWLWNQTVFGRRWRAALLLYVRKWERTKRGCPCYLTMNVQMGLRVHQVLWRGGSVNLTRHW